MVYAQEGACQQEALVLSAQAKGIQRGLCAGLARDAQSQMCLRWASPQLCPQLLGSLLRVDCVGQGWQAACTGALCS